MGVVANLIAAAFRGLTPRPPRPQKATRAGKPATTAQNKRKPKRKK